MSVKRANFTMLFLLILLALFIGSSAPNVSAAVQTPFTEPFNNQAQFTTNTPFFSDGAGDYFGITDGTAVASDFGGGALPSELKPYTGLTGSFLTGMDLDGEGASLPLVLDWTGIDISGLSNLVFSGDFAEFFDDPGDIDLAEYLLLEYQIDGDGYQNLLRFSGIATNGLFYEDTDFDGVGDGTPLGDAAQSFTKSISGIGSVLDLRLSVRLDAGDEDFGADNFQITGDNESAFDDIPQVNSTSPANGATGAAVDAPVTVTFNEAVVLNGTFDIMCAPSGNDQTGLTPSTTDNRTFSFTHTNFIEGDTCSLTIPAASVSDADTDDPPDNMAADYTFSFGIFEATVEPPATDLLITGVVDGPLTGGVPKAVEFYVINDIADLSIYGFGSANNGGGSDGQEFTFPAVPATAGSFVYVASEVTGFTDFFGFAPDYTGGAADVNGDDAIELFQSGGVVDVFGEINVDGTGQAWDCLDGWAYRVDETGPDGSTFVLANWTFSGIDALDGETSNGTAVTPFPIGSYVPLQSTGPVAYKIHEIQGSGLASPVVGQQVMIEGVVVSDFQAVGQLGGFNVQEEETDVDADPVTSEGIFVYHVDADVNVGDLVQVSGTVAEFNGLTEITPVSNVTIIGSGSVAATAVSLPVASLDGLEAVEGMLVTFPQDLVISEYFNFDRYNEIVLTSERPYQPTATFDPGSPEAAAMAEANVLSRITLDDGRTTQNSDPALHPNGAEFTISNTFRGGDVLQNVTGVMDYANGQYKIQPTQGAVYLPQNPRTTQPDDVGGSITVASFNVLNYFSTIDAGVFICGPAEDQGCRGADTPEEFQRQRDKIFAALAAIDADVVGLIEIENHVTDAAVQDLVSGLNEYLGYEAYAYVATGPIGSDAIKQAFIYKPASVSPVGAFAVLDATVDGRFLDDYNRPALAQTFLDRYTGGHFTVIVNHLKSKGSDCNAIGDPDLGDGAGNCNLTRKMAAEALVDWLATDPTGSDDPDFLIIGDLNSYDKEDPIDAILAGADDIVGSGDDYTDLLYTFVGENAYSYVFNGQLGYLDHGLANAALLPQVTGATAWHINADEADLIDYDMTFKLDAQDALWEPTPYRSSDHDPVVIGLQLEPDDLIVNEDGCYVIGIQGTPYPYAYNLVTTAHRSLKYYGWSWGSYNYLFKAVVWAFVEGVPPDSCYEIHGTNKKDLIIAGPGDDAIFGYGQRDTLYGLKGDDLFTGGDGRDAFFGGSGFDTVLDYEKGDRCVSIEQGYHPPKCKHKKHTMIVTT